MILQSSIKYWIVFGISTTPPPPPPIKTETRNVPDKETR